MTNLENMRRRFIAQTELGTLKIANEIEKHPDPSTALGELYFQTIEQIWADDSCTNNAGDDRDGEARSDNTNTTDMSSDGGTSTYPTPPSAPSSRDPSGARAVIAVSQQIVTHRTLTARLRPQEGGAACA